MKYLIIKISKSNKQLEREIVKVLKWEAFRYYEQPPNDTCNIFRCLNFFKVLKLITKSNYLKIIVYIFFVLDTHMSSTNKVVLTFDFFLFNNRKSNILYYWLEHSPQPYKVFLHIISKLVFNICSTHYKLIKIAKTK